MKNYALWFLGLFLLTYQNTLYTSANFSVTRTQQQTSWDNITDSNFIGTLNNMLGYVVGLLYFIAIVFALYGGFLILTAGWEEDRVKKGKTTLIQAVIGLIVIFLASNIIQWIISIFIDGWWAVGWV